MELDGTTLRHIRYGALEIVESVAGSVRDLQWNTLPGVIVRSSLASGPTRFHATVETEHAYRGLDFRARTTVDGDQSGVVHYSFRGRAESEFRYMRIGLAIVHPIATHRDRRFVAHGADGECRGILPHDITPVRVDGEHELPLIAAFDRLVLDLDGALATFTFEGDLFEMEDQRNWADASYKTFCTPLSKPVPFTARVGMRIEQSMRLEVSPQSPPRRRPSQRVELSDEAMGRVPQLGYSVPVAHRLASRFPRRLLRLLHPAHIRAELDTGDPDWPTRLSVALAMTKALESALELCVVDRDRPVGLESVISQLAKTSIPAGSRLIVVPDPNSVEAQWTIGPADILRTRTMLANAGLRMDVVVGSDGSFCEFNRDPGRAQSADGVAFPLCPTVHAADDDSLMGNLSVQGAIVAQAVRTASGMPVHVSPITLASRYGPYPTGPDGWAEHPAGVDPRQTSLLGAVWTAGSLAQVSTGGAATATYFDTHGERGVAGGVSGRRPRAETRSGQAMAYPMFPVLMDVADRAEDTLMRTDLADEARLGALATRRGSSFRVMLANLQSSEQRMRLVGLTGRSVRLRVLDSASLDAATEHPTSFRRRHDHEPITRAGLHLVLPPYGVVWVETGGADEAKVGSA
jgi:hypothetical protein